MEDLETERGPVIPGGAGRMPETFRAEGISPPHPGGGWPEPRRARSLRRLGPAREQALPGA